MQQPSDTKVLDEFLKYLPIKSGIQFYAGNYLDGTLTGHGGKLYPFRSGLFQDPSFSR